MKEFYGSVKGRVRRFGRDRKAGPATEFAMVGSAFFIILCCIFTLSLDMYWQLEMDGAVRAATRQVQIQKITTGTGFVSAVCGELGLVASNCAAGLQYSVQTGTYFGTSSDSSSIIGSAGNLTTSGLTQTANFPSSITATISGAPQFLLVQVALPVPFSLFAGVNPVVTQNGTSYLYSAVATVIEP